MSLVVVFVIIGRLSVLVGHSVGQSICCTMLVLVCGSIKMGESIKQSIFSFLCSIGVTGSWLELGVNGRLEIESTDIWLKLKLPGIINVCRSTVIGNNVVFIFITPLGPSVVDGVVFFKQLS